MDVPDESYCIPFGQARTVREGEDVTLVALGRMVGLAEQAAQALEAEGISVAVIDPRTLSPLDTDSILDSVEETGRAVIVDEATPLCSVASEIASMIVSDGFSSLRAPIKKVTAPHTPVPASPVLEAAYAPNVERIKAAVKAVHEYR